MKCVVTVALVALASTAVAQDSVEDPASTDAMILMGERNREEIHPGNPLRIRGLGMEGDEFLSGTPALARSEFAPLELEEDEAYQARLAMMGGARFDAPLSSTSRGSSLPPHEGASVMEKRNEKPARPRRLAALIGVGSVAVVVVGFWLTRNR